MKKFILPLISASIIFVACGDSVINKAQGFVPNNAPEIQDLTFEFPSGITSDSISNDMTIRITVQARDPEGKPLEYTFASAAGIFSNIVTTDTGCTAELYTRNVTGNSAAYMTVTVTDAKGASHTWQRQIGIGRSGPKVDLTANPDDYIKPSADTGFVFSSVNEGYYQVRCDNSATADTIAINYDDPVYMYVPSGDAANPKKVTVSVAGLYSTNSGRIKLTTDNAPNRVWIIFWDGLKQYDIKCLVINQDSIAPSFTAITPDGTDNGVRSNVGVVFSEPVELSAGGFTVRDSSNSDITSRFGSIISSGNSINLVAGTDLDYNESYSVAAKSDLVVTDRAGNICTTNYSSIAGTFSTQALGTLAKPVFRYYDSDSTVANGTIFAYDSQQMVRAVYTGAESGVSINWTSAVGGMPGEPAVNYTKTSNETVAFSKNSGIIAKACKKGYVTNTGSLSVKIRTKTPAITPTGTAAGDKYAGVYSSLTVTISGNGGESFLYSARTDGNEPGTPTISGTSLLFNTHGERVRIKAQATSDNMEPSEIASGGIYRVRSREVPNVEVITDAEPGKMPWRGVAISAEGKLLAAVEDGSVRYLGAGSGYIWISHNGGVSWKAVNNTVNAKWSCVAIGEFTDINTGHTDYTIVAGANPGYLYTSKDTGVTWDSNKSDSANWTSVSSSSDGAALYAAATGLNIYRKNGTGDWFEDTGGKNNWTGITMSINTGYVFAVENSGKGSLMGNIWVYASGTWSTLSNAGAKNWSCISVDDGAKYIVAGVSDGCLYESSDWGDTFTPRANDIGRNWYTVAFSPDYKYFFAGENNGSIWISEKGTGVIKEQLKLSRNWQSIAPARGAVGTMVAAAYNDYLYLTDDLFTGYQIRGPRIWKALASSADGVHLAGAVYNGSVYVSHNSGVSWTMITNPSGGNSQWIGVAISSDGTKIAAIDTLNLYVLSNGSWLPKINDVFTGISMSSGGDIITASSSDYYHGWGASRIYTSTDYGNNWGYEAPAGLPKFKAVSMSANGSVKAVITSELYGTNPNYYNIKVYKSSMWYDYRVSTTSSLSAVAVSPNGNYIAVTETSGGIFYSSDGGVSWSNISYSESKNWKGITISNGGKVINALCSDGEIFSLYDFYLPWTYQKFAGEDMWSCIAATDDGLDIIAGSFGANNPVILR